MMADVAWREVEPAPPDPITVEVIGSAFARDPVLSERDLREGRYSGPSDAGKV